MRLLLALLLPLASREAQRETEALAAPGQQEESLLLEAAAKESALEVPVSAPVLALGV